MFMRTLSKTVLGAAAATCLMFSAAQAAPIMDASFGFTGAFDPAPGTHLGNTTGFFVANGGQVIVSAPGQADLAPFLTLGTLGTMADIPSFAGFVPVNDFFSINGVTFDLNTFTVIGQYGPLPGFINAVGTGVLSAPGFDDTLGTITLSGTSVNNLAFTFGVTAEAHGVPEPFSIALLGLGLLGAYGMRRKFAKLPA